MESLPPYVIYQILKRSDFEDRLLTLQYVCVDWKRWTPLDDLATLKISDFERLRLGPDLWRRQVPSSEYFQSKQKWLESLLAQVIPKVGSSVERIHFDSVWPRVNDTPPLFCAPEGFKRWTLTKPMLTSIQEHCGSRLKELILTEQNFVYTDIEPDAYPILASFPKLRRLAVARIDASFGPHLRHLSLNSLSISGEDAPLETADPENLKSLHLAHPFPKSYGDHTAFYLSRNFPNLENHSENLLVEFEQLSESAQRKRLADYRQLPNLKRFRIQLGPENGVRTELPSISGYGLPKLQGVVNLQVRRLGDLAANVRFLGQLQRVKVEGSLNCHDALALFTSLPSLKHLTFVRRWTQSDRENAENQSIGSTAEGEDCVNSAKFNLGKLRSLRVTLWDQAPSWLGPILKRALASSVSLRSFRLEDFSGNEENNEQKLLLEEIGLHQAREHLNTLKCRVGSGRICQDNLSFLLQTKWPKLSTFVWHAAHLSLDQRLTSDIARNFPNLRRFIIVPPSGPLRPLLPGTSRDESTCQFEPSSLARMIESLPRLQELRLFASSIVEENLIRAIASHKNLKSVKLWDGVLRSDVEPLQSLLSEFNESGVRKAKKGYRRRPVFVEIFALRSPYRERVPEQAHRFCDGSVFFLANGRSYAIDEQSFYFP